MLYQMVDVYLPDFKYGLEEDAVLFSQAPVYPRFALDSLHEMVRQVGDDLVLQNGVASHGIIVRHLVLPGRLTNSKEVLRLIKKEISTKVPISLMSQYTPISKVSKDHALGRRITSDEYNQILDYTLQLGFENLFVQEVSDQELTPDFSQANPFY